MGVSFSGTGEAGAAGGDAQLPPGTQRVFKRYLMN